MSAAAQLNPGLMRPNLVPQIFRLGLLCSLLLTPLGCTRGQSDKASLPPPGAEMPKVEATTPAAAATAEGTAQAAAPTAPQAAAAGAPVAATAPANAGVLPTAPAAAPDGGKSAVDYRLTGEVTAIRHSQIGFRVGGVIKTVVTKAGQLAKKGEVLATLDDRDFVVRVELAQARLNAARVNAEEAERDFRREQALKQENASTAMTYDRAKATYDQARINVRLAELDLRNAEYALSDTKLTAPYDCAIAQQLHYDGEQVNSPPVTPVLDIYDLSEPEVTLSAPERMFGQLQIGSKLAVTIQSASYSGKASVIRLVPVIANRTRTFQVVAKLGQWDAKIIPGSYAEATLD